MTEPLPTSTEGNQLFPVFFRLDKLQMLVVGGGLVGLEKTTAIFKNSTNAQVTIVAPEIRPEIVALSEQFPKLRLVYKPYDISDLEGMDLVVAATCIAELNQQVRTDAKVKKILINVADTPESCDFYLGSVVKKGELKIAISTNGKSPTFAKRVRELLEEALPDSIDKVLDNLRHLRERLKGDFEYKVKKLDEITSVMREKGDGEEL
jgi:precorrin-2 dehydrogenase / sirohydrochlorin ferrochelatase